MHMSAPLFEVGVIFHNNAALVPAFFFFLRQSCRVPFRVLAVEQGSSDGTVDRIRSELASWDRLSTWPDNRGVSGGRNRVLGMREPSLPLLLLDSDCFVMQAGSCEALLHAVETECDMAWAVQRGFHHGERSKPGYSAAMFRPEVFERIGGFNEEFRMFYDDTVHYEQACRAGLKARVVEEAHVLHLWGSTTHATDVWRTALEQDRRVYDRVRPSG